MAWQGTLKLRYRSERAAPHQAADVAAGAAPRVASRTVLHDLHDGPLRVLASLYPEGSAVCHNVLVHPPGGIVGGDTLHIDAQLAPGAHALITTPGATRFYRSAGAVAVQTLNARLADNARLEWLPLETIAYAGTLAENRMQFMLAASAEMIGWDVLALGLPASEEPFEDRDGHYTQQIELPSVWLERGRIDAADTRLLDSPLGFAGRRVLATLWFAAGAPVADMQREALIESAREIAAADPLSLPSGITSPHPEVVVLRVLASRVEPAMMLLTRVWARWRQLAWDMPACTPRVWRT